YFTLPLVALSAMPVTRYHGGFSTQLARGPEEGGHANDPVLGIVDNLGVHGTTLHLLRIYVGILAATILFIATNAGVIGASRITSRWRRIGRSRRSSAGCTRGSRHPGSRS